jgi:hypothetical protein
VTVRRCPSAHRGISTIELLIATTVLTVVFGAMFGLLQSAMHTWTIQPHASEQLQRLRVAVSSLQGHLTEGGGGAPAAAESAALHDYFAPVLPYRFGNVGADPPGTVRPDVISVMYVPQRPAFSTVLALRPDAVNQTTVDIPLDCGASARPRCGFVAGQQVVLLDSAGGFDRGTVALAADGVVAVQHTAPLRVRADADPVIAELAMHTYYLGPRAGPGTPKLLHYDGDRTNMPVVDDVAALAFEYWGEPLPPAVMRTAPRPRVTYGPAPPPVGIAGGALWPDGENCTFAVVDGFHVPRLAALGPAGPPVPLPAAVLSDGPWCPDASDPERYDADLLRIRRVRVRLRIQADVPWLRRPPGAFALADLGAEVDVSPRALMLERRWQ